MRYVALIISVWLIIAGFLPISSSYQSTNGMVCGGIILVMSFLAMKEEVNWQNITVTVISLMLLISAFFSFYASHPRWYDFTWGWILIIDLVFCKACEKRPRTNAKKNVGK